MKNKLFCHLLIMFCLLNALPAYASETAQVIEELIPMAKYFQTALKNDEALGLSPDEVASYDARADNENSVREIMRAKLRNLMRRSLRRWKYPSDKQDAAVELVMKQAEVLCEGWV